MPNNKTVQRMDDGRTEEHRGIAVIAPSEVTAAERISIMVICGNCTEEEANTYLQSEEYRRSLAEWEER